MIQYIYSNMAYFVGRCLELLSLQLRKISNHIDSYLFRRRLQRVGIVNFGSIPSFTRQDELVKLYQLASTRRPHALALEIGSYLGASTCYLAAGLAKVGGHLFCVDTWNNEAMPDGIRDTFAEFEKNTRGVRPYITPIRKRSSELVPTDVKVPFDLVFIDGDHSYPAVKSDFEFAQQWLTPDGIIAFHDFSSHHEGVVLVVSQALASCQWTIGGCQRTLVWIKRAT